MASFFGCQPSGDEFFRFPLQVILQFFVKFLLDLPSAEQRAQAQWHNVKPMFQAHGYASSSPTTCVMASESRVQLAASFSSCLRPSRVSE